MEHQLADNLARGGRDAESMGRRGDNHIVARPVRDVDDRQIVGDLLHHAGPASDYRHVRRSRKQFGQPPRDVPYKGGVGLVGITGQAHVGPFVGSSAKKKIAPRGLAAVESIPHKGDIE